MASIKLQEKVRL